MKYLRVNERIRRPQVRLIDADGKQLGVVPREEALRLAREKFLDLVEIVPTASPPVCKILDYGKYKYEQSKREKHKYKVLHTKEIKLRLKTQAADRKVKLRHAEAFLARGHKVKVSLRFRGREIIYANQGKDMLRDCAEALNEVSVVEQPPKIDRKVASILLSPKRSKDAKIKDQQVS